MSVRLTQAIADMIKQAIQAAQEAGVLPKVTLPDIVIERPQNAEHGDYASSIALKLARAIKNNPMTIANVIISFIKPSQEIENVTVGDSHRIVFYRSR